MNSNIFRAYDVRGIFGIDFQPKDFYRIARAYADRFQPQTVALGHDVRESSPQLWKQAGDGLQDAGVDVLNLGQISTDMLYFAVARYQTDGGITISASHNPAPYNGMKLVRGRYRSRRILGSLMCGMPSKAIADSRNRTPVNAAPFGCVHFLMHTSRISDRLWICSSCLKNE